MSDRLTDSPERLRLGIDLDGVVADFNGGWIARYNRDFGADLDASMVREWDGLERLTHFRSMSEFWEWARGEGPPRSGTRRRCQVPSRRPAGSRSATDWSS